MKLNKLVKLAMIGAALLVLNGCSSQKDFVRPQTGAFSLGKTTEAEVIKVMGKPRFESLPEAKMNDEPIKIDTYFYNENASFWGMIIEKHSQVFSFFKDLMVGEFYSSTYDKDTTKFDLEKIPQIKLGMTSAEVIAIMGKPSGSAIYPVIKTKEGSGLIYAYNYERFAGILTSPNDYLLLVTLDSTGKVSDVMYKKDGKDQVIKN